MRIKQLDFLRAIAILIVVLAHGGTRFLPGGYGVTLFFVISGFVITSLILREYESSSKFNLYNFAVRRILKIVPPFLGIVILPSIILFETLDIDFKAMLMQGVLFYNWWVIENDSQGVLPGSSVVWSLSIEEQFYIFFALIWWVIVRVQSSIKWLLVITLMIWVVSTSVRIFYALQNLVHDETGNVPRIYYGSDTRMSSIASGVILAIIFNSQRINHRYMWIQQLLFSRLSFHLALVMLVLSFAIRNEFFRGTLRFSMQEIASAILVAGSTSKDSWPKYLRKISEKRLFQSIGQGSYSIYLVHLSIIILINNSFSAPFKLIPLIAISSAIIFGLITHQIFDAPFEKVRKRYRTTSINLKAN